jgi:hypothetical protein
MLIAYSLGFTNRKRTYFEEKTTATLKSKQTSIATVRNHLRTLASFPNPLIFHWSLPLSPGKPHLGPEGLSRLFAALLQHPLRDHLDSLQLLAQVLHLVEIIANFRVELFPRSV